MTYHVGLFAKRSRKGTLAIFQFRRTVDELDCEILEYLGERSTTKEAARQRLADTKSHVLEQLNREYPRKNFQDVRID